jgi:hypothetical protein
VVLKPEIPGTPEGIRVNLRCGLGKLLITNRQGLGIGIPAGDDTSIATGVSPWKTKINKVKPPQGGGTK